MRCDIIKEYLRKSKAPPEQIALYLHLDQPFLFRSPVKTLKEIIQIESTTKEPTEEEKDLKQNQAGSIDTNATA